MPTCIICLDVLKDPAALPCGHVFCYECIVRLVRNVEPYVKQHFCPTCRHEYTIATIDSALVPSHLKLHISPSIRKLKVDYSLPRGNTSESLQLECERLRAENASLRACSSVWCQRARLHARTTMGLVGMVHVTKDMLSKLQSEKAELESRLKAELRKSPVLEETLRSSPILKRKMEPYPSPPAYAPPSPSQSDSSSCSSDCSECEKPLKRRRRTVE